MRLWLGGYGPDMDGTLPGIGVVHAGAAAEQSAAGPLAFVGIAGAAPSPSWLTAHPTLPVVYAALEGFGGVQAFRRTGAETLEPLGPAVSTGAFTCHVAISPDARLLVATAYGDGAVAFIPVGEDGRLGTAEFGALPADPYGAASGGIDPALGGLAASGFTLAASPAATELSDAADALRAAVGAEFADLVPSYGAFAGDADDEFARFLAEQEAASLSPEEVQRRLAGDVAAAIIAEVPAGAAAAEPTTARAPHAHQACFLSNGLIATTDLGYDLVRFWCETPSGFTAVQTVVLPQGTGPRHMVWHPSGHLHVVTEYSCEVYTLAPDATGRWAIIAAVPVAREMAVGMDFPSELSMSRSGEHLYAGVRGQNTIATLAVKANGARLEPVAAVDAQVN